MNLVPNIWGLQEETINGWIVSAQEVTSVHTGRKYRADSPDLTAVKVFLVALLIVPTAALTMVYNLVGAACSCDISPRLEKHLWNVVRAPVYALSIEFVALTTLVTALIVDAKASYVGRAYIADLEYKWGNHTPLTQEFRTLFGKEGLGKALIEGKTCYLAPCFQALSSAD